MWSKTVILSLFVGLQVFAAGPNSLWDTTNPEAELVFNKTKQNGLYLSDRSSATLTISGLGAKLLFEQMTEPMMVVDSEKTQRKIGKSMTCESTESWLSFYYSCQIKITETKSGEIGF